jgi:hypothetical protein
MLTFWAVTAEAKGLRSRGYRTRSSSTAVMVGFTVQSAVSSVATRIRTASSATFGSSLRALRHPAEAHVPVRELANSSPHTTANAETRQLREPAISNFWQVRPCIEPGGRVFRLGASA